jgi:hypothetical protein
VCLSIIFKSLSIPVFIYLKREAFRAVTAKCENHGPKVYQTPLILEALARPSQPFYERYNRTSLKYAGNITQQLLRYAFVSNLSSRSPVHTCTVHISALQDVLVALCEVPSSHMLTRTEKDLRKLREGKAVARLRFERDKPSKYKPQLLLLD